LEEKYNFQAFNILGKCVIKSSLPSPLGEGQGVKLDVSHLTNGMYQILIQDEIKLVLYIFLVAK